MRPNVREFVRLAQIHLALRGPVYEFGAYQVAGQEEVSDLRPLFPGQRYVGCDMRAGPGVDLVLDLAGLSLPDGAAQTAVCVDTLEHVFEARRALDELHRILAPSGVLLISAPMHFRIHDYPEDFWRFTPACIERLLLPFDLSIVGWQGRETFPHTVFGIACKGPLVESRVSAASGLIAAFQDWLDSQAKAIPLSARWKRWRRLFSASIADRPCDREYHNARFTLHLRASAEITDDLPAFQPFEHVGGRLDNLV